MKKLLLYIAVLTAVGIGYSRQSGNELPERMPRATDSIPSSYDSLPGVEGLKALETPLEFPFDSLPPEDGIIKDSVALTDTTKVLLDTTRTRFSKINRDAPDIKSPVTFSAKDSLVMNKGNAAHLYGDGNVEYEDFKLNSAEIRMDLDSSTVYANGVPDSVGELANTPIFKDKSGEYESKTMKYNFKSQRGYITGVITEQQDGYLTGGRAKRMDDGAFFVEDGKYTTCEDHENPHFYFQLTKAKVRPQKDVVTGPGYMVLMGVPLPLALPFGYFPFSEKYSSGVLFPSIGEDYNRGFYLRDGGYYFAINDNVDLAIRGEIYTKGSWGLSAYSNYVKRYKYRGTFDISFLQTVTGDKGTADYQKMRNFQVIWSHSQDAKANPNLSFSASVNFATSGYSRNDLNSYYNSSFTENTKSSTVNMTYRFPGTKWSLSATANITQRSQDSTLAVSFPNLTVTMSQLAPFKRKKSVGGEKWYEKIKMSYSGQFQNSLTSGQDEFFKKNIIKDWRNGMKHYVPISATFNLFKYLHISPSVTLNDRMYTSKIKRQWDSQASREVQDTTYGFYNVFDFNVGMSFDTKLYGFWKPMKFLGDKVQMIRHVLTPTVSFNYAPDFGSKGWGYYNYYMMTDQAGNQTRRDYSYFSHGIFGVPGRGMNSAVTVALANNLEMKVKSDKDSTGYKKVSLIENLSLSQSYNFAADSLKLSPLQMSVTMRLIKNFNLNFNTTWDPYVYRPDANGSVRQINKFRWNAHQGFMKLSSFSTSFSYTLSNDTFKRKKDTDSDRDREPGEDDDEITEEDSFSDMATRKRSRQKSQVVNNSDNDGYEKWQFPWSLSLNYSVSYGYGDYDYKKLDYKGRWMQNLSISGSVRPTPNWNFSFSASYNFELHKLAYMNCSISRDIHCFTMSASFVPVGPYKSYNFHIAVKSSLLKDLKYDQRSQSSNGVQWY